MCFTIKSAYHLAFSENIQSNPVESSNARNRQCLEVHLKFRGSKQSEGLSMAWLQFCKDILPTKLALTAKKVVPNPFLFICMAGNLSPLGMPDGVK